MATSIIKQSLASTVNAIKAKTDLIQSGASFDGGMYFRGTLGGDVLTLIKELPVGVSYYQASNNPTNCPPSCNWGAYVFFKNLNGRTLAFYADSSHFACAYSISNDATTITWHVV